MPTTAQTEQTYTRITMTIVWVSSAGRQSTRRVDLGHCRSTTNFNALAVLNIGMRGDVVSYSVAPTA